MFNFTQFSHAQIKKHIKEQEGLSLTLYQCPAGKWTIGYGWNLSDNGIPKDIAEMLFEQAFNRATFHACNYVGINCWSSLSPARQDVLIDMAYNLGPGGLGSFKKLRSALQHKNYEAAAREMEDSVWHEQVGKRARKLVWIMRFNRWPKDVS